MRFVIVGLQPRMNQCYKLDRSSLACIINGDIKSRRQNGEHHNW